MAICGNCGKDNPPDAKFCNSCAKELAPPAGRVCPSCGAPNAPEMIYCGQCGATLDSAKTVSVGAPIKPSVEPRNPTSGLPRRYCRHCGTEVDMWDTECPHCHQDPTFVAPISASSGSEYTELAYDYGPSKSASGALIGGAVFAILAGVLALGQGVLSTFVSVAFYAPTGMICLCGGLDVLFGLASLAGGIMALRRSNFTLALLGAILGMLGFGFLIGALFGLIAVILIAVSRNDFD